MSEFDEAVGNNNLGDIIRSIRMSNECIFGHNRCRNHLTQQCLAGILDIGKSHLSRVEVGLKLTFNKALIICKELGLELDDYLGGTLIGKESDGRDLRGVRGAHRMMEDYKDVMDRFRSDLITKRKSTICEDGCCRDTLSLKHCGALFGFSKSSYRWVEEGGCIIRFEIFLMICKYFGLNPADYIGDHALPAGNNDDGLGKAMNWVGAHRGRVAFDVSGDGAVTVMVPGYAPRSGDTIIEAVAWLKYEVAGKKIDKQREVA